jgi:hypothetical protein
MEDERIEAEYAAIQGEPLSTFAAFILPNASPDDSTDWDILYVEKDGEGTRRVSADLAWAAQELLAACEEFVRKCEHGEARSTRSYAQMKSAIALAKGEKS